MKISLPNVNVLKRSLVPGKNDHTISLEALK